MADISGPGGSITLPSGFACHFQGWSGTILPTVVENTGFAENGNRTSLVTAQIVIGSAHGTAMTGQTMLPSGITGATPTLSSYIGTVTLLAYTNGTMSFNATITAIPLGREALGKMEYGVSFQSNGPLLGVF